MELLPILGIIGFVVFMAILAASSWFAVIKPNQIGIVSYFGGKPDEILGPGWYFIPYPMRQLKVIAIKRQTLNVKDFKAVCIVDPNKLGLAASNLQAGVASLNVGELSVNYEVSFKDIAQTGEEVEMVIIQPDGTLVKEKRHSWKEDLATTDDKKLNRVEIYFRYLDETVEPTKALSKLEEEIRDMVQSVVRDLLDNHDLLDAIKVNPALDRAVEHQVQEECVRKEIPVHIVSIKTNTPPQPVDEEISKALKTLSQGPVLTSAEKTELARKELVATREAEIAQRKAAIDVATRTQVASASVEIGRLEAEKQAVTLRGLTAALGVDKLPEADRPQYWITRDALEAYREMARSPNKTILVGQGVLNEIAAVLGKFAGKVTP